ncbi:MAG TPA: DUF1549 domain-containing protein, partial [Isosphaeraceae bacterium]
YQRGDGKAKSDGGVSGTIERVDAYKIGEDLYVNVAPAGSGRVLLEKITKGSAPASDPMRAKEASAPKRPEPPDLAATLREEAVRGLSAISSEQPHVFLLDGKAKPADPTAAADFWQVLVDGRNGAGDAQFVRRLYLDLLGRVPTAEETKAFVGSSAPDKAEALAHRLLDDPAAVERIKQSLRARIESRVAQARKEAAKPVRFTIEGATLDRVNIPAGDLIDIHLDNGPHDPNNPAAEQQTIFGLRDGQVMTSVTPPATRIQGLAVAVDAPIRIEVDGRIETAGAGEAMLKHLKPGMRLTLGVVAEGPMLAVRSITARPASQTAATQGDPFFLYFKPAEPEQRR